MKQIRYNVFETNSSSTHSIAIPKSCEKFNFVRFEIDEFGWEFDEVNPANYFYTAIYEVSNSIAEAKERLEKLSKILDDRGIRYEFGDVLTKEYVGDWDGCIHMYLDDGYIDHGGGLKDFVDELLNDGDKLIRLLFGGLVFTGNDNTNFIEEHGFVNRHEEKLDDGHYNCKTRSWEPNFIDNPYYMKDHENYDWYFKGN